MVISTIICKVTADGLIGIITNTCCIRIMIKVWPPRVAEHTAGKVNNITEIAVAYTAYFIFFTAYFPLFIFAPGLADLNHIDLNHDFKLFFFFFFFLWKIRDLNKYFFLKIMNKSKLFWFNDFLVLACFEVRNYTYY